MVDNPLPGGNAPDLFSKIGPLPAWAWGALVVGAYWLWSRNGSAAAVDNPTTDDLSYGEVSGVPDDYTASDGASSLDPYTAGYNYQDVNEGNYGGTVTGSVFTSNQQWGVYVIGALTKQGYPAAVTTTAVTYYLAGKELTQAEADIVTAAIAQYGPPPLPMPIKLKATATPTTTTTGGSHPSTRTLSTAAPAAPKLSGSQTANRTVTLKWNAPTLAVRYLVYRDSVIVATIRDTSWKSGSQRKGAKHSYRVKAIGYNGKISEHSNIVTITIR